MTTHIKNAEYRRFWEARVRCWNEDHRMDFADACAMADDDATEWASRFADPETLADIEANEMKRGQA